MLATDYTGLTWDAYEDVKRGRKFPKDPKHNFSVIGGVSPTLPPPSLLPHPHPHPLTPHPPRTDRMLWRCRFCGLLQTFLSPDHLLRGRFWPDRGL